MNVSVGKIQKGEIVMNDSIKPGQVWLDTDGKPSA